jgi:Protein of unknown function (DUF2934)
MKTKSPPQDVFEPSEDDIRDYACHLYEQSGCIPGRDLDNWLEARECLRARGQSANVETHLQKRAGELMAHR